MKYQQKTNVEAVCFYLEGGTICIYYLWQQDFLYILSSFSSYEKNNGFHEKYRRLVKIANFHFIFDKKLVILFTNQKNCVIMKPTI